VFAGLILELCGGLGINQRQIALFAGKFNLFDEWSAGANCGGFKKTWDSLHKRLASNKSSYEIIFLSCGFS